jgi:hypothetical protein
MDQLPAEMYGIAREEAVRELELAQTFNDSSMYRCPGTK